jgi:catechol 2,3-dioxygenase
MSEAPTGITERTALHRYSSARIGHVNLKVSDLNRSLAFYEGILGMRVTKRIGDTAAFLAHGDYHHDLCINTWQSRAGSPAPPGTTGLFHFAVVYSDRGEFIEMYRRLKEAGVNIDNVVDHGVTQSIYFRDPDENGVELYWDRPTAVWFDETGGLKMGHRPMQEEELLRDETSKP